MRQVCAGRADNICTDTVISITERAANEKGRGKKAWQTQGCSFLRLSWLTPTEILDGIQVGDYNKMDYGNSNVAGKMRRSDGRTDDKEYDGIRTL